MRLAGRDVTVSEAGRDMTVSEAGWDVTVSETESLGLFRSLSYSSR